MIILKMLNFDLTTKIILTNTIRVSFKKIKIWKSPLISLQLEHSRAINL